ncbi:CynX/NimT family MFS transporter [Sinomonas gamaensis]|uniref:CynX/NimT family MFS transporter n=1 Tax=Sinomonas gamaensis TaxID=2565624 RepID=UPI001107EBA3|nr:MFS transporter [Sinomonas gamaensis]
MSEKGTTTAPEDAAKPTPGRRGRIVAGAGILIVAFTLRIAVTSVPPLTGMIAKDLFLPSWLIGILGMLPTALFGAAGLVTPLLMRRWSVETLAVGCMVAAGAGQIVRAVAPETGLFLAGSALALAGMGAGNVVLPPMVKKYFPRRIGLLTALYVTVISLGTTVPPVLAVPVADSAGWRVSIGWWAAVNAIAILPWLTAWSPQERRRRKAPARASSAPRVVVRPWHSPSAWALALLFGCTSLNTYTLFAWLPPLVAGAGLTPGEAGLQLAIFSGVGLPMSLIVPVLASRLRNPFPIVVFGVSCFVAGYLGLLLAPATATWLWSTLAGLGPATFPLSLVLVNLRTHSHQASGAVSGFAQGLGYLLACAGPLFAGILHDATGAWTASFAFLGVTLVILAVAGWVVCRPRFIEDHPGVVVPARFQGGTTPPVT